MCEYCKGGGEKRKLLYVNETTEIGIIGKNTIDIYYCEGIGLEKNFFRKLFGIKYCPMCGRKLESEVQDETKACGLCRNETLHNDKLHGKRHEAQRNGLQIYKG